MIFRVHFIDGAKVDISAGSAKAAGEVARGMHPDGVAAGSKTTIRKIKLVRSK
ncbi:hypothetical protein [Mesorhizobium captivum]|uniref:hypothetical protein n=1 Tax=Mesorhizobium captivum TaxID=3072319 RepID=UPI002A247F45|nr:hypothetical protein [Mesorhizobium sp. VK23E]MDX8513576.1 hypothetical protein [Mesorhizobium sp. VK23E]